MQRFENICFTLVMLIGAIGVMTHITNKRVERPSCIVQYKECLKSEEIEVPKLRETQIPR